MDNESNKREGTEMGWLIHNCRLGDWSKVLMHSVKHSRMGQLKTKMWQDHPTKQGLGWVKNSDRRSWHDARKEVGVVCHK